MIGFSKVIRGAVERFCERTRVSIERLAELMNIPVMTMRRYAYDTMQTEPGSGGEEIKNPNHINIPSQQLINLIEITKDRELIEYIPHTQGAVVIWPGEYKELTPKSIRQTIRRLTKVLDWMDDHGVADDAVYIQTLRVAEDLLNRAQRRDKNDSTE